MVAVAAAAVMMLMSFFQWIATIANASKDNSSVGDMLSAVDSRGVRSTPEVYIKPLFDFE